MKFKAEDFDTEQMYNAAQKYRFAKLSFQNEVSKAFSDLQQEMANHANDVLEANKIQCGDVDLPEDAFDNPMISLDIYKRLQDKYDKLTQENDHHCDLIEGMNKALVEAEIHVFRASFTTTSSDKDHNEAEVAEEWLTKYGTKK